MLDAGKGLNPIYIWYFEKIIIILRFFCWGVVELVRRLTLDQKVVGSSPTAPARFFSGGIV